MMDSSQIREHMKVVGSNGQPIGTVDRVEGNRIKLTKGDAAEHRYVELSDVSDIKNGEVCVSGNQSMQTAQTKSNLNQNGGQPGQNQMERGDQDPAARSQGRPSSQGGQGHQKAGQHGEFGTQGQQPGKAQQVNQNGEIKPAVKGSANLGDKRG